MIFKFLVILFLIVILWALGSALYFLVREKNKADSVRVVKALSWRIGLSIFLFILLLIAYSLGWIVPHRI